MKIIKRSNWLTTIFAMPLPQCRRFIQGHWIAVNLNVISILRCIWNHQTKPTFSVQSLVPKNSLHFAIRHCTQSSETASDWSVSDDRNHTMKFITFWNKKKNSQIFELISTVDFHQQQTPSFIFQAQYLYFAKLPAWYLQQLAPFTVRYNAEKQKKKQQFTYTKGYKWQKRKRKRTIWSTISRDAGMGVHYGGTTPCPLKRGQGGNRCLYITDFISNFVIWQDRPETNLLQLFAHT